MIKKLFVLILFLILFFFFFLLFSQEVLLISNSKFFNIFASSSINFLILGKPGPGYIGSENTDSIVVLHYDKNSNQIFLIPIPRDLIIKDEKGNLEKINTLYEKKKLNLLLEKASAFTGFSIKNYLIFDLTFVIKLVDFLGGIEVNLQEPVADAVTLYTLPAGKQKLNGYFVELILRSRYHREGDFFRIKNHIEVFKGLKEKIVNLNTQEKLALMKFLDQNRYHWQTNLSKKELMSLAMQIKNPVEIKLTPIIIDLDSRLLTSNYFKIYNSENVYGIYPTAGIDDYRYLRSFIQSEIKK